MKKLLTCNLKWHKYSLVRQIASSSNGRTADSDSVSLGSSPGSPATLRAKSLKTNELGFFMLGEMLALLTKLLTNLVSTGGCHDIVQSRLFLIMPYCAFPETPAILPVKNRSGFLCARQTKK